MASLISRSVTCWSPTLARVELLMPKPMLPEPKLVMSPMAKPARIASRTMTMMIGADLGFGQAAEEGEHRDLGLMGKWRPL